MIMKFLLILIFNFCFVLLLQENNEWNGWFEDCLQNLTVGGGQEIDTKGGWWAEVRVGVLAA